MPAKPRFRVTVLHDIENCAIPLESRTHLDRIQATLVRQAVSAVDPEHPLATNTSADVIRHADVLWRVVYGWNTITDLVKGSESAAGLRRNMQILGWRELVGPLKDKESADKVLQQELLDWHDNWQFLQPDAQVRSVCVLVSGDTDFQDTIKRVHREGCNIVLVQNRASEATVISAPPPQRRLRWRSVLASAAMHAAAGPGSTYAGASARAMPVQPSAIVFRGGQLGGSATIAAAAAAAAASSAALVLPTASSVAAMSVRGASGPSNTAHAAKAHVAAASQEALSGLRPTAHRQVVKRGDHVVGRVCLPAHHRILLQDLVSAEQHITASWPKVAGKGDVVWLELTAHSAQQELVSRKLQRFATMSQDVVNSSTPIPAGTPVSTVGRVFTRFRANCGLNVALATLDAKKQLCDFNRGDSAFMQLSVLQTSAEKLPGLVSNLRAALGATQATNPDSSRARTPAPTSSPSALAATGALSQSLPYPSHVLSMLHTPTFGHKGTAHWASFHELAVVVPLIQVNVAAVASKWTTARLSCTVASRPHPAVCRVQLAGQVPQSMIEKVAHALATRCDNALFATLQLAATGEKAYKHAAACHIKTRDVSALLLKRDGTPAPNFASASTVMLAGFTRKPCVDAVEHMQRELGISGVSWYCRNAVCLAGLSITRATAAPSSSSSSSSKLVSAVQASSAAQDPLTNLHACFHKQVHAAGPGKRSSMCTVHAALKPLVEEALPSLVQGRLGSNGWTKTWSLDPGNRMRRQLTLTGAFPDEALLRAAQSVESRCQNAVYGKADLYGVSVDSIQVATIEAQRTQGLSVMFGIGNEARLQYASGASCMYLIALDAVPMVAARDAIERILQVPVQCSSKIRLPSSLTQASRSARSVPAAPARPARAVPAKEPSSRAAHTGSIWQQLAASSDDDSGSEGSSPISAGADPGPAQLQTPAHATPAGAPSKTGPAQAKLQVSSKTSLQSAPAGHGDIEASPAASHGRAAGVSKATPTGASLAASRCAGASESTAAQPQIRRTAAQDAQAHRLVDDHMAMYRTIRSEFSNCKYKVDIDCHVGLRDEAAAGPLRSLRPVVLADLPLGMPLHGSVLLCRAIAPPLVMSACMSVVEDAAGDSARLALYNFLQSHPDNAERELPSGCVLAIKHPYLKFNMDGGTSVRVDNPANIVMLHPSHAYLRGTPFGAAAAPKTRSQLAAEHRAAGNAAFKAADYGQAMELYNSAVQAASAELSEHPECAEALDLLTVCSSNAAETALRRDDFDTALQCAERALRYTPGHPKSTLRRYRAMIQLGRQADVRREVQGMLTSGQLRDKKFESSLRALLSGE